MFLYGMRERGVSPGAQPKGMVAFYPPSLKYRQYWNVIAYENQLTEKDIRDYELDFIGEVRQ